MRFSLRWFLAAVALVAISFAAITLADPWWDGAVRLLIGVCVLTATLIAIVDRGATQAFALGFVICVLGNLGLSHTELTITGNNLVRTGADRFARTFPDVYVLNSGEVITSAEFNQKERADPSFPLNVASHRRSYIARMFVRIVELIMGILGGVFATVIYVRRVRSHSTGG